MSKQTTEVQIQELGLTAPRITLDHVKSLIVKEDYYVFPETTVTVCCLTLRNGFTVTGTSACASPENFNKSLGEKVARENAEEEIWKLEGYLLKQALWDSQFNSAG